MRLPGIPKKMAHKHKKRSTQKKGGIQYNNNKEQGSQGLVLFNLELGRSFLFLFFLGPGINESK